MTAPTEQELGAAFAHEIINLINACGANSELDLETFAASLPPDARCYDLEDNAGKDIFITRDGIDCRFKIGKNDQPDEFWPATLIEADCEIEDSGYSIHFDNFDSKDSVSIVSAGEGSKAWACFLSELTECLGDFEAFPGLEDKLRKVRNLANSLFGDGVDK